jgi:hypothetical protein
MAEQFFVDAAMRGSGAYIDLQLHCLTATLNALDRAYEAATDDVQRDQIVSKITDIGSASASYLISSYAKSILPRFAKYTFNAGFTYLWAEHLDEDAMSRMHMLAIMSRHWFAIREMFYPRRDRIFAMREVYFTLDIDDFQCLMDIARACDEERSIARFWYRNVTRITPPLPHLWAMYDPLSMEGICDVAAKHGIVNKVAVHHNVYRIAVERLFALMMCVTDEYLHDKHGGSFYNIVKQLPNDLHGVLANRVYDCSRNVVVLRRGLYWALKLGDCHQGIYGPNI